MNYNFDLPSENAVDFFKVAAILSPFISGYLSYFFATRNKKLEILYENKIPAFKNIVMELVKLKQFLLSKISENESPEISPYTNLGGSSFERHRNLSFAFDSNAVFLSRKSKQVIEKVLDALPPAMNYEIDEILKPGANTFKGYSDILKMANDAIEQLYKDLNLIKH